jgi:hypothetical protein
MSDEDKLFALILALLAGGASAFGNCVEDAKHILAQLQPSQPK